SLFISPQPPASTLFPYTTLFRSHDESAADRMRRSLLYRLMPAPFVMAGMFAIWRLCRRERYDVVHVHWPVPLALWGWAARRARRSEEHTSELQSRFDLVCRLLLE